MPPYRAGVIGLGWMGLLSDLGKRSWERYDIDDVERPTPELDAQRRFQYYSPQGKADVPHSWAEVMWDRPEVELVAGAERDRQRLDVLAQRYGVEAIYEDAAEMLRRERLDIVAIATNVKGRADLTCLAVECGVNGIATEKPMTHTLAEADRMVAACADAGVPLCCGAIPTNHPAFARAKQLLDEGAIGELLSIEAEAPHAQKQYWSYFVDSMPTWVCGSGYEERKASGSDEFRGQGVMATEDGFLVHFRKGTASVRLSGADGEMVLGEKWRLWLDVEMAAGRRRVEMPWPEPQLEGGYNAVYGLADLIDCLEGRLDEPKNSGRCIARALEVEIGLVQSANKGGVRVDLPLADRDLGLNYDWFR